MEPEERAQRGQTGCVGWGVLVEAVSDGREPMGRGIGWVLGRCPAGAVLVACCIVGFPTEAALAWGCVERSTWGRLQRKALAKAFAVLLACGSIKATELGLGAAWDTWTDTDPTQTHAHTREGQFIKDVFSVHGEG